jgi:hypothetical protein
LLLLDADVIVFAYQLGVWEKLRSAYQLHVPAVAMIANAAAADAGDDDDDDGRRTASPRGSVSRVNASSRPMA